MFNTRHNKKWQCHRRDSSLAFKMTIITLSSKKRGCWSSDKSIHIEEELYEIYGAVWLRLYPKANVVISFSLEDVAMFMDNSFSLDLNFAEAEVA